MNIVELGGLVIRLLLELVHLGKLLLYLLNRHAVDVVGIPLLRWDVGTGSPQVTNISASVTLGGFDPGNRRGWRLWFGGRRPEGLRD